MQTYVSTYDSPFGRIILNSDGTNLTALFFERPGSTTRHLSSGAVSDLPIFRQTRQWLDIYFSGQAPGFMPPYRLVGATPFRAQVSAEMLKIPFGETRTYGELAASIAQRQGIAKMSAQAVGGAVGWNPISLIIPCHRVIGAKGKLTGYAGGLDLKEQLLAHETQKAHFPSFHSSSPML